MSEDKDRSEYADHTKRPIVTKDYVHGVRVVSIDDLRIARGAPKHHFTKCRHNEIVFSTQERAIWCDECETRLDPFDVFVMLVERQDWVQRQFQALEKLKEQTLISRASREFDEQFRRRKSVPCCPKCYQAIFPEDVVKGLPSTDKEQAMQARRFAKRGKR